MITKPEHTRPFNLDHAMAGAPISTAERGPARFVAYSEEADVSCCVVVLDYRGIVGTRRKSGRVNETDAVDNPFDLVMVPLGYIDDRPVFVGDKFLWPVSHEPRIASPDMAGGDWSACRWPAPAKVYPETRMTEKERWGSIRAAGIENFNIGTGRAEGDEYLKHTPADITAAIANAALRHAIDAGQVVPVADVAAMSGKLDKAVATLEQAGYTDNGGLLWKPPIGNRPTPEYRAARDIAVAQGVLDVCARAAMFTSAYPDIRTVNLNQIIAKVA